MTAGPSRFVLLAVAAVLTPVPSVLAPVPSVIAAVLAPISPAVHAVGDDRGTTDGSDGPPAASGCKWHVRLLP